MKRVGLVLLCLVILCLLCACGDGDLSHRDDKNKTKTVAAARASVCVMNVTTDESDSGVPANGLDSSQKLVDECIVMMKANSVIQEVADWYARGGGTITEEDVSALREALDVQRRPGTSLLDVTIRPWNDAISEEELLMVCRRLLDVAASAVDEATHGTTQIKVVYEPSIIEVAIE